MTTTWAPVMRKRPAVPPKPTWKPCLLLGANFRTFPDLILLSSRPTTTPTTDASQTQEHTQLRAMQMLSLIIIPNESATARLVVLLVIPISTACGGPITPCCSKAFSLPGTSPRLCQHQLCQVQLQLVGGSSWRPMQAIASPRKACFWIPLRAVSPWKSWQKTALGVLRRRKPHGARRRWSCYRQKTGRPASK